MLASGSLDKLEFEHHDVRDPEAEKVDKEIKEELGKIPSRFWRDSGKILVEIWRKSAKNICFVSI